MNQGHCTEESLPGTVDAQTRVGGLPVGEIGLQVVSIPAEPFAWPRRLTSAEREVARLLVRGCSYREMARARGVSEETISAHVSSLMRKTGADSAARLVAYLCADRGT